MQTLPIVKSVGKSGKIQNIINMRRHEKYKVRSQPVKSHQRQMYRKILSKKEKSSYLVQWIDSSVLPNLLYLLSKIPLDVPELLMMYPKKVSLLKMTSLMLIAFLQCLFCSSNLAIHSVFNHRIYLQVFQVSVAVLGSLVKLIVRLCVRSFRHHIQSEFVYQMHLILHNHV